MLYTSMGREMLWVVIPFVWTKSLSMKLSVALKSKSTLTECISLVLVVLISIGRTMDVPWASRALVESCLGSLFFHLGLQGRAFLFRVEGRSASIGSQISVLTSSMFNTANVRATGHKTPGESSEIRMRLLEGCSTLYTGSAFRVSVIGAILVCLSITLVILEQA